jgi:DNA repair photolyase
LSNSLIYEPRGRAREFAALACNVYNGCDHACLYCYAPLVIKLSRDLFKEPQTRPNFIQQLEHDARNLQRRGVTGQVLLSFTCDPYQMLDEQEAQTQAAIQILHAHGFDVCVLTKGGLRAMRDVDLFGAHDGFAVTLTLLDNAESLAWEPGAALPTERIQALEAYHVADIPTWVSLEPVLDPEISLEIIRRVHGFVDRFKVGKLNYHPLAKDIDWPRFAHDVVALLTRLGYRRTDGVDFASAGRGERQFYIKNDLAVFL